MGVGQPGHVPGHAGRHLRHYL
ncbi:hypothetical protein A2U01_0117836, partial [Trifolium medium]|nr:hypothetical protein [Trifolium medium]